ncbi:MAG: radical SAM protein [Candidatus Gastranaerophilales bacterium]|nr:radical SAM protein [Candidatus Gastranaerophilales bacterium]
MKRYYCNHMFNEINFDVEKIMMCSGISAGASHELYDEKKGKSYDEFITELLKWRKSVVKKAFCGLIPKECKNCLELEEKDISLSDYLNGIFKNDFPISKIYVKTYRQCELSCVYCLERRFTHGKQTLEVVKSDYYDFLPIMKKMTEMNMIDKENTLISFHGGSISVWDEFDDVIDTAYNYGIKNFEFLTNAYRFLPKIAEIAKDRNVSISVSLDSGCKETYQKIKNSDKFEEVVNNIVEYSKANVNVVFKYIILKDINDSIEELQKFLDTVTDVITRTGKDNGFCVMIDIDYRDILDPEYVMPQEHKDMLTYFEEWGKNVKTDTYMQEYVRRKYEEKQPS